MLAIDSSFYSVLASADEVLALIADAGFDGVLWAQMTKGDFHYLPEERRAVRNAFRRWGLRAASVHANEPRRRSFFSEKCYERQAGVELLLNRMKLAADLECPVVVFHAPSPLPTSTDALCRGMDEVFSRSAGWGVKLAVENGGTPEVRFLLERYPKEVLGYAYDSGHGFCEGNAQELETHCFDRLITVHLHDNDGIQDQHKIPFTGQIDWPAEAAKLTAAHWSGDILLESCERSHTFPSHEAFLRQAYQSAYRLQQLFQQTPEAKK